MWKSNGFHVTPGANASTAQSRMMNAPSVPLAGAQLARLHGRSHQSHAEEGKLALQLCCRLYRDGRSCAGPPEAGQLADVLRDPSEQRLRIAAALSAFVNESEKRGIGDSSHKAAVGFCFGGACFELARVDAADLSFHL